MRGYGRGVPEHDLSDLTTGDCCCVCYAELLLLVLVIVLGGLLCLTLVIIVVLAAFVHALRSRTSQKPADSGQT